MTETKKKELQSVQVFGRKKEAMAVAYVKKGNGQIRVRFSLFIKVIHVGWSILGIGVNKSL